MFNKLNRSTARSVREGIDLETLKFAKLKEFIGQTLYVDGFFFTNGEYGRQVVVVANGYKVNMPSRAVEQFEEIYNDAELLQGVLDGHLGINEIQQVKTKKGYTISYSFFDR